MLPVGLVDLLHRLVGVGRIRNDPVKPNLLPVREGADGRVLSTVLCARQVTDSIAIRAIVPSAERDRGRQGPKGVCT